MPTTASDPPGVSASSFVASASVNAFVSALLSYSVLSAAAVVSPSTVIAIEPLCVPLDAVARKENSSASVSPEARPSKSSAVSNEKTPPAVSAAVPPTPETLTRFE